VNLTKLNFQFNTNKKKHQKRFEPDPSYKNQIGGALKNKAYIFLKRSLYERLLSRVLQMLPSMNENEEKEEEPDEEEFLEVIGPTGNLIQVVKNYDLFVILF